MARRAFRRLPAHAVLELAVLQDGHRPGAIGFRERRGGRIRRHFNGVQRASGGALGAGQFERKFPGDHGPQGRVPVAELPVEIITPVAFPARIQALGPQRFQPAVNQLGHRLVSAGPIPVAAAKHGIPHPAQGMGRGRLVAQPTAEFHRVVGRGAVVRRRDDQHGAFGRELVDKVVQRAGSHIKVQRLGRVAHLLCHAFGRAHVRPKQHQQRRVVPLGHHHRRRRGRHCLALAHRLGNR